MKKTKVLLDKTEIREFTKQIKDINRLLKKAEKDVNKDLRWLTDLKMERLEEIQDYFITKDVLLVLEETVQLGYVWSIDLKSLIGEDDAIHD